MSPQQCRQIDAQAPVSPCETLVLPSSPPCTPLSIPQDVPYSLEKPQGSLLREIALEPSKLYHEKALVLTLPKGQEPAFIYHGQTHSTYGNGLATVSRNQNAVKFDESTTAIENPYMRVEKSPASGSNPNLVEYSVYFLRAHALGEQQVSVRLHNIDYQLSATVPPPPLPTPSVPKTSAGTPKEGDLKELRPNPALSVQPETLDPEKGRIAVSKDGTKMAEKPKQNLASSSTPSLLRAEIEVAPAPKLKAVDVAVEASTAKGKEKESDKGSGVVKSGIPVVSRPTETKKSLEGSAVEFDDRALVGIVSDLRKDSKTNIFCLSVQSIDPLTRAPIPRLFEIEKKSSDTYELRDQRITRINGKLSVLWQDKYTLRSLGETRWSISSSEEFKDINTQGKTLSTLLNEGGDKSHLKKMFAEIRELQIRQLDTLRRSGGGEK